MPDLPLTPNKKTFSALLGLLLLLFVLVTTRALVGRRQEIRKKAAGEDYVTILELSAAGQGNNNFTIAPGELFQVDLKLIPNRTLSAVDIVLDFDRSLLILEGILPNRNSNLKTFVPLDKSGNFEKNAIIATANDEGVLRFGAVTFSHADEQTSNPQSLPVDPLITFTFRARPTSQGEAVIEFGTHGFTTEGATTDSNAVAYGETVVDILARPTTRIRATIKEPAPPEGDLNNDGQVGSQDLRILLESWGPSSLILEADLNLDGIVNGLDFGKLRQIAEE